MENNLKTIYGKRTTPGVKILMLIVAIIFGLHLVFTQADQGDKTHAPVNTSIYIQPDSIDS